MQQIRQKIGPVGCGTITREHHVVARDKALGFREPGIELVRGPDDLRLSQRRGILEAGGGTRGAAEDAMKIGADKMTLSGSERMADHAGQAQHLPLCQVGVGKTRLRKIVCRRVRSRVIPGAVRAYSRLRQRLVIGVRALNDTLGWNLSSGHEQPGSQQCQEVSRGDPARAPFPANRHTRDTNAWFGRHGSRV